MYSKENWKIFYAPLDAIITIVTIRIAVRITPSGSMMLANDVDCWQVKWK